MPVFSFAFLLVVACGCLGLAGGCGGGAPATGTQVVVDQKEQEDLQGRMQDFMAKKGKGGKTAKKSP